MRRDGFYNEIEKSISAITRRNECTAAVHHCISDVAYNRCSYPVMKPSLRLRRRDRKLVIYVVQLRSRESPHYLAIRILPVSVISKL